MKERARKPRRPSGEPGLSRSAPILAAAELLSGTRPRPSGRSRSARSRATRRTPRSTTNSRTSRSTTASIARRGISRPRRSSSTRDRSKGYGLLGLNQLRLRDIEGGKKSLDRSFEGDPFNVWIKNTLDLMDTYPSYVTTRTPRFEIVIEGKESDLLTGYVERIAEEAYESLAERYEFQPETPIRIEVYPSHGDFSVRTLGLPGLGALGVCFGPVIAVDSPSARPKGQFNWASTLWHELAHTVTLGATDHKVPRWLSEGLSVLEERAGPPRLGRRRDPRVPRGQEARGAPENRGAQQRLHAPDLSPADRDLVLPGVPRLRAHRAGFRVFRDPRHAGRLPARAVYRRRFPAGAEDGARRVRHRLRRLPRRAVRGPGRTHFVSRRRSRRKARPRPRSPPKSCVPAPKRTSSTSSRSSRRVGRRSRTARRSGP